MKLTVILY